MASKVSRLSKEKLVKELDIKGVKEYFIKELDLNKGTEEEKLFKDFDNTYSTDTLMYLALTVRIEESLCTKIKKLAEKGKVSYSKAYKVVKRGLNTSQVEIWDKAQKDCDDLIEKLYSLAEENK